MIDPKIIKSLGFRKISKQEKKQARYQGATHYHSALNLVIYSDHTDNQVVKNFLQKLAHNYNVESLDVLGFYLSKIL
jgi:hypothetical protein